MINFNSTEKKKGNFHGDTSINITGIIDTDHRYYQKSNNLQNNINSQLHNNYNQIKQLLKERKKLLQKKAQAMISENRARIQSIASARPQNLRNEAKMLGDRSTEQLVESADTFNGPRSLLKKIENISNMSSFESNQKDKGKKFWQINKEFEREIKKKNELYVNQSKQLQGINQKVRSIFVEIERLESEMIGLLIKDRRDPDHIKKAQKFNQEIEKKKLVLRDAKLQKQKIKNTIQKTIDSILEYNRGHESTFKGRANDLDEIFGGKQNLGQFDTFLRNLQIVIENKQQETRNQQSQFGLLKRLIKDYDILIQQIDKSKTQESQVFHAISEEYRQKLKLAVLEKAYLSGISNPREQVELLNKCRTYRKLIIQFDAERPIITDSISKMSQMTKMLYPVKKAYESEETRKHKLKQILGIMMAQNSKIERKLKDQRDYAFDMQNLRKRREVIQFELDECAEKANFNEYKNKVKELQKIDRQVELRKESVNDIEMRRQQQQLISELQHLNETYSDLIEQIIVDDKKMHIATYINKLNKRLTLL